MSKLKSNGTLEDEFITVTEEEYAFVHWNWTVPSATVYHGYNSGEYTTVYKVICPEYTKLRQTRLMKLLTNV